MDPQRVPVIGAGTGTEAPTGDGPAAPAAARADLARQPAGGPPDRPPAGRAPLRRDRDAAVLGGVAAGIARALDLDVALVRIAFVLVALALDGIGVLAYLAAWAVVPAGAPSPGIAPTPRRRPGAWIGGALVALGGYLGLEALADLWGWTAWRPWQWDWLGDDLVLPVGLVVIGALLWWRAGAGGAAGIEEGRVAREPLTPSGPPADRTPAPRSRLTPLVLGLALMALGGLWSLDVLGATSLGMTRIAGATLLVIAGGLLVGAFAGRARGLMLPGALLALLVLGMVGVRPGIPMFAPGSLAAGGSIVEAPANLIELPPRGYRWAAGDVVLDLRALDAASQLSSGGPAIITAELGVGTLEVRVPDDVTVEATANVGIGTLEVPFEIGLEGEVGIGRLVAPGSDQRGLALNWEELPLDDVATMVLRIDVGVGRLVITR